MSGGGPTRASRPLAGRQAGKVDRGDVMSGAVVVVVVVGRESRCVDAEVASCLWRSGASSVAVRRELPTQVNRTHNQWSSEETTPSCFILFYFFQILSMLVSARPRSNASHDLYILIFCFIFCVFIYG